MAKLPRSDTAQIDREPVTQDQFEALASFRLELRRYLAFAHRAAQTYGVTMEQHQAMLAIQAANQGFLSTGKLAELLFLRPHSTVELVDRLVKLELVVRSGDPTDGRRTLISLTDRGRAMLQKLAASHLAELRRLGPDLGRVLRRAVKSSTA